METEVAVYFQLVLPNGEPFEDYNVVVLLVSPNSHLGQLREAIYSDLTGNKRRIDSGKLTVFGNEDHFKRSLIDRQSNPPLKGFTLMRDISTSDDEPLFIVVPNSLRTPKMSSQVQPMAVDTSLTAVENAIKSLESMIRVSSTKQGQSVFNDQDSMEFLELDKNTCIKIKIPTVNKIPDFLFSEDVYNDEKSIGVDMPVDKLVLWPHKTIVLIGASGCGKTRTCFDLCRREWGLYFDCTVDDDFKVMLQFLKRRKPLHKDEFTQALFEDKTERFIICLLAARMLVWKVLADNNPSITAFEWLCYQMSRRSQSLFAQLFVALADLDPQISGQIYRKLIVLVPNKRVILDESQYMFTLLQNDYRSPHPDKRGLAARGPAHPRSFFSFISSYFIHSDWRSIWCGTQMKIKNMELFYSSAGGKPEQIGVFTDFTYLEPVHIKALLSKWLIPPEDDSIVDEVAEVLQGRPRLLMSYLQDLMQSNDMRRCLDEFVDFTSTAWGSDSADSFYRFWKDRIGENVSPLLITEPLQSALAAKSVAQILTDLCLSYLFGKENAIEYSPDIDLVSTALVMVKKLSKSTWSARMVEPLVIMAGLNYLNDTDPTALLRCFTRHMFSQVNALSRSPQERGRMMQLIICLRFLQKWWKDDGMEQFLPVGFDRMAQDGPIGVIDNRIRKNAPDMFVAQLTNPNFRYILLPSEKAGSDLRFAIFSVYSKTTWVPSSGSSMTVSSSQVKRNRSVMTSDQVYTSDVTMQKLCKAAKIDTTKFVHLYFEMPYMDNSQIPKKRVGVDDNGHFCIYADLDSEFTRLFFGEEFVSSYKDSVRQFLDEIKYV